MLCYVVARLWAGRPRDLGSIPSSGKRFLLYPKCPDRLWGPLGTVGTTAAATHLNLVPRLRLCGAIPTHPHSLRFVVLNELSRVLNGNGPI